MRNEVTAVSKSSTRTLTSGQWYALELHAIVNGTASTIEVSVDGTKLTDVSTTAANLGTTNIGVAQIGENASALTYNFAFDDVAVLRSGGSSSITRARTVAVSCTSRSSVRLHAPKRQRVGRTGFVNFALTSAEPCKLTATAVATSRGKKRRTVKSRAARLTLPGDHAKTVKLAFAGSALRTIRQDLSGGRVYVIVSAAGRQPLAKRKVLVTP
jgi:hypothetical protein